MKRQIKLFIILILILTGCSNSNTEKNNIIQESIYSDKFIISIGEDFFNSFLAQIGEISGEQRVKFSKMLKIIKIDKDIKWTIKEMTLDIEEDKTSMVGKILVEVDGEIIESTFKSKVSFEYNNEEEKLKIIPREMRIKKLANIDITSFYTPVFEVKVSNPFNKEVKFKMPDGTYKLISIKTEATIKSEKDRIDIMMKYTN